MIKSTHTRNSKLKSKPFPKLMISNDVEDPSTVILLAKSKGEGMVVYSDSFSFTLGYYSTCWDMDRFEDYIGEVVLKEC